MQALTAALEETKAAHIQAAQVADARALGATGAQDGGGGGAGEWKAKYDALEKQIKFKKVGIHIYPGRLTKDGSS